jgi:hypothetical protein
LVRVLARLILILVGLILVLVGLILTRLILVLAGLRLLSLRGGGCCAYKWASPRQRAGKCQRSHGGKVDEIAL